MSSLASLRRDGELMLNHLSNGLFGANRVVLASALLLWGTLFPARPALPSPLPRTVGQIVELVNSQGRSVYINSTASGPLSAAFRTPASKASLSDFARRAADPGLASVIRQAADRHQMDPDLIHAIINVESGYDSRALSPKGAMGLMQLIPATARRFGVEDPFDPKQNIEGGTSYLKYLLDLFGNDLALSLAAYNAGENSVLREGGIPPFPETRQYVRKVTSFYQPNSASNGSEGKPGAGNAVPRACGPIRATRSGTVTAATAQSTSAPLYTYIDAQGMMHIEQ